MLPSTRTFSVAYRIGPRELARRASIECLERELAKLPQIELEVKHHFAPGVYVRTMFIPVGVALVGHIHKHACVTIVQKGRIAVATEKGVVELVAPCTLESPAGTKRAGYALEDTIFSTIHANPHEWRDIDRLEDFLIAEDYDGALPASKMGFLGEGHAEEHR